MGFLSKLFGSKKYGGYIKELELVDFWDSLNKKEREKVREYSKERMGGFDKEIDDPDFDINTSDSASSFLNSKANSAISDKEYKLAEKLLLESLKRNNEDDEPVTLHFTYNNLIKLFYKLRDQKDYLEKCITVCKEDISLYENKLKDHSFFQDKNTKIPSFKRLAIIYKKQKEYKKAIEVCKKAIKYNLRDGTNTGFQGRLERLKKKIN